MNSSKSATDVALYDDEFYEHLSVISRRSAEVVAPLVLDLVPARSVCDIGCGAGSWLTVFKELGVADILGLDGTHVRPEILQIAKDEFRATNLFQAFEIGRTFDLALSLEVGEHLPESSAAEFVHILTRAAPVVLFSAAIPFQGGTGHINEQWPTYWATHFASNGYVPIDAIRPQIWTDSRVADYYRQNVLIFCRADRLANYPGLSKCGVARTLALVHPERYAKILSARYNLDRDGTLKDVLESLPVIVKRSLRSHLSALIRR
jgi:SAM-dependent methyltransferase